MIGQRRALQLRQVTAVTALVFNHGMLDIGKPRAAHQLHRLGKLFVQKLQDIRHSLLALPTTDEANVQFINVNHIFFILGPRYCDENNERCGLINCCINCFV